MCFNKSNTALGINNGNWTKWSAILAEITSMILDQNCTTWGSVTTLLHPFWNCPNTGLGQFLYFIDTVLSRFEIKLIYLGGGGVGKIKKLQNLPHDTLCLSIWLKSLPWSLEIWLVVLFLVWPAHWLGKRCNLKQKWCDSRINRTN